MTTLLQELLVIVNEGEKKKKTPKVPKNTAKRVYHRDYLRTKNKAYRKYHPDDKKTGE